MAALTIDISDPMLEFIDGLVRPDGFAAREDVVKAAIADWQEQNDDFLAAIQEGLDAIERGEVEEVDDLEAWFADLRPSWQG